MEPGTYQFDLQRIFLGDLPLLFVLEIMLRTTVMYVYALLILRLLGKRGMGQLTPFEFIVVIALGSAMGDPMFYSDVPLLHGLVVLTLIVLLERGLEALTNKSVRFEHFVESIPRALVKNGQIDKRTLEHERLSVEELLIALREGGVEQLGEVKRAYLEPSGRVST
ncbi:MAG: DUF421 domain-containing protein, partial [Ardenticatenaceae bacterium]